MNHKYPLGKWLKEKLFKTKNDPPDNKKGNKLHYLVILFLIGVAFMLINDLGRNDKHKNTLEVSNQLEQEDEEVETFGKEKRKDKWTMHDYEENYENQLKEALEAINGVGQVKIVVNVEASERDIYEKNAVLQNQITNETDKQGGKRKVEEQSQDEKHVIIKDGNREVPIISETKKPEIKGVLVVANGADNLKVKKWIVEAVTRTLDVPSHKVAVLPKKAKEDE